MIGRKSIIRETVIIVVLETVRFLLTDRLHTIGMDADKEFLGAYDAYADAIFRHAYLRLGDREKGKDVMQETFCRAWSARMEGTKVEHMRGFLYRIANNIIIDEVRKKKSLSLDMLMEEGFDPSDTKAEDSDKQLYNDVLALTSHLDPDYRLPVMLRYVDDMSVGEIAEALGLSENVVSVRIHRGIAKLRSLVEEKSL